MTRLAVDFGASFADFVVWDDQTTRFLKLPTGQAPEDTLAAALDQLALDVAQLAEVHVVTTAPLNALLEQRPAEVALITTTGFADTLSLGRQNRVALYDPVAKSPAPAFLVAPDNIFEVAGRLDATGHEISLIDQSDLNGVIAAIKSAEIKAVAVCLLFSHVNAAHEREIARALQEAMPDVAISLSHEVDPAPREYERTVSTVLDAWLGAVVSREMDAMSSLLADRGFGGALKYGDGRGVLVSASLAQADRVKILAGAPAAAARAAAAAAPEQAVIAVDVGSQSADMSLSRGAEIVTEPIGSLAGVSFRTETADMASIALGGARGIGVFRERLHFHSCDASAATLDDAFASLGLLSHQGGDSLERLAVELGVSQDVAAHRIIASAEGELAAEITRFATRRNIDPTRASLVMMGGAGALLAAGVAEAMGLHKVVLPRAPAAAGAVGLALSSRRAEVRLPVATPLLDLDLTLFEQMEADLGGSPGRTCFALSLAARRQMHPIFLRLADKPTSVDEIAAAFTRAYAETYGIAPPGSGHVFHALAWRDAPTRALPVVPPMAQCASGLVKTEAGSIWVPDDWELSTLNDAYLLRKAVS